MFRLPTTYTTEFDIAALILTLMLLLTLMLRRSYPTAAIRWYKHILFCNILSSASDFISAYTICNPQAVSLPLNYVINICFYLFHNLTAVFFMMYVIAAIRKNNGTRVEQQLWRVLLAVIIIMTLTTPFTKALFYFDENLVYCHGKLFFLLYVMTAISILYSVYIIFRYRSSMSAFQIRTDIAFILLVIGSILFQSTLKHCLIEDFIISIACVMMDVALDNPGIYFYKNTSCYNQTAFDASMESRLSSGAVLDIVTFAYNDLSVIKKQLTAGEYDELLLSTIRLCQQTAGRNRVYFLENDIFAIFCEVGESGGLIRELDAALSAARSFSDGRAVTVTPHFGVLQMPVEALNVNDLNLVIQDTLTHIYRKTGEHIIRDSVKALDALHRQNAVVHRLRDAIRNDGITVQYQPLLNVKTGVFTCMEALVRLRDNPEKTFPDEFIPLAEENGLIYEIGEAVLERVCAFLRESGCMEYGIEQVNVNLSMLQLVNRSALERLAAICRKHGVSPRSIVFEVTETAAEGDGSADVQENIGFLKQSGFSLSLDDYGSGYSNLNNLIRFSFDQVKIDKALLWGAVNSRESLSVLENAVKLVQNFGMNCVVEGVENEEMVALLSGMNVDYYQGYRYSKPVPPEALVEFLKARNEVRS